MPKPGIAPPDFSTPVGQFRLLASDTSYVALDPPVSGQGDYTYYSDAEIEGYLTVTEDNPYRAVGFAYIALANIAAQSAESIKDFDLAVDSRQKAEQLRIQAQWFFDKADELDAEGAEGFTIVRTGRRLTRAELAEVNIADLDLTEFIV